MVFFSLCLVSGLGWLFFYSFCNRIPSIFSSIIFWGCYLAAVIGCGGGVGVFKGVPGEGKYDMALESLYKSSTYFFTLFSLLYIYRGVTNYGGKYKCFELFCLARNIMVIRAHDRGLGYVSGIIANTVIM